MSRCIELARRGEFTAAPNPMVGAVIVHEGRIIGEGWHRRCGGPHAEVNAVASVREADRPLLREATMYVSLEPCSHWGRTPPCADMLAELRLRRVVVGCVDPFAEVRGRGIQRLQQAGIDVEVGVLQDECLHLNRRFITFHTRQRPWVTLKWAQSADGYIDRRRNSIADGQPVRFSTEWTQTLVHRLRATHQAIVVGRRTWELDAPSLTTRYWRGPSPQRYILSTTMQAPLSIVHCPLSIVHSVEALLHDAHQRNLQALLVEGGACTLQAFIDADIWDEAYIETAPFNLAEGSVLSHVEGVPAPHFTHDIGQRQVHRIGSSSTNYTN